MPSKHRLSIVIPALDEEAAIGDTIQRCLDARQEILERADTEIELIVVSDGSTDRTVEIAKGFADVAVLVFRENRGYGAAIKTGFEHGTGNLVGFLDADGTCDPLTFADLCLELEARGADIVLGSRIGPGSKMPPVRWLGNQLFSWMLGLLSKRVVGDTASGMRVIRRSALQAIYPLPNGLHFTPAMSARVLLEDKLELIEVPMSYSERIGQSKLSVVKDGVRFLTSILQAAMCYRPSRPLFLLAGLLGLAGIALGWRPVATWLTAGLVQEGMVYRILLSSLLLTQAGLTGCAGAVAEGIAATVHNREAATRGLSGFVVRLLSKQRMLWLMFLLVAGAAATSFPGFVEYLETGFVTMHWSRAALSSLLVVLATETGITAFLFEMLTLVRAQRGTVLGEPPPDEMYATRARATAT